MVLFFGKERFNNIHWDNFIGGRVSYEKRAFALFVTKLHSPRKSMTCGNMRFCRSWRKKPSSVQLTSPGIKRCLKGRYV